MKMMKRTLSILLTIVVGIVLLTSCGQSGSSQPAVSAGGASAGDTQSASDKGEPTKVVFAMQTFNVVPPTETIQTVADEVNRYIRETYPEVNIELEWVLYGPGDYAKKINLMMQSGDQLDIFIPSNIATSLSTNQLAPITEALETYGQDLTADTVPYCAFMTMGEWGTESYMWGLEDGKTEEEKQANRDYALTVNKTIPKSPYYGFRFDGSDVKNEITALTNVFEQYAYPLMCGSVDVDSTLEEFNKALYDAGLQTVMDAKQEQLDAWVAQNS